MLKLYLIVLVGLIFLPLGAQWEYLGLSEVSINKISLHEDNLYAATDNGLYVKDVTRPDTIWTHVGLEDEGLMGLLIIDENSFIVSKSDFETDNFIVRTDNAGEEWYPFIEGIERDRNMFVRDFDIYQDEDETIIIAAGSLIITRHSTQTNRWELVHGRWGNIGGSYFIKFAHSSPEIAWAGGETAFFAPSLAKSVDYGMNWELLDVWGGGDNRCLSIATDPNNRDIAYIGMGGIIVKTVNGGQDWYTVLATGIDDPYYSFTGVFVSDHDSDVVYASGYRSGDYRDIKLFVSLDAGEEWTSESFEHGRYRVMSMDYRATSSADELYLATTEGGILRYSKYLLDTPIVETEVVTIDEMDYISLHWQVIEDAASYKIYSTNDPNVLDWGEPIAINSETQFVQPLTDAAKKFFRVTASAEEAP